MVSRFQGFIQIGVGVGIAIGIDCLTTEHFLGFQGFMVSRFQDFIGVGIAIAIGIDHLTTASPPHSLTAFEIAGSARISIRQNPMFAGGC